MTSTDVKISEKISQWIEYLGLNKTTDMQTTTATVKKPPNDT